MKTTLFCTTLSLSTNGWNYKLDAIPGCISMLHFTSGQFKIKLSDIGQIDSYSENSKFTYRYFVYHWDEHSKTVVNALRDKIFSEMQKANEKLMQLQKIILFEKIPVNNSNSTNNTKNTTNGTVHQSIA